MGHKILLSSRATLLLRTQKVRSEVATTKWVKANTSIPVPSIHGFDAEVQQSGMQLVAHSLQWIKYMERAFPRHSGPV